MFIAITMSSIVQYLLLNAKQVSMLTISGRKEFLFLDTMCPLREKILSEVTDVAVEENSFRAADDSSGNSVS